MDILHSPAEVGAGEDGSDDKNDAGSLLQPVPWKDCDRVGFVWFHEFNRQRDDEW